jgi:hypothetical protein
VESPLHRSAVCARRSVRVRMSTDPARSGSRLGSAQAARLRYGDVQEKPGFEERLSMNVIITKMHEAK